VTDMHADMLEAIHESDGAGAARKSHPTRMPPGFFIEGAEALLFGNALFTAREGASGFDEASDRAGVEGYWPWGPSAGDLDADGWTDLFVTAGMNYPYRYEPNAVFLNMEGRRFARAEFVLGVEPRPRGATTQPWFTLDCAPGGADAGSASCRDCMVGDELARRVCPADPARAGGFTVMGTRGSRSAVVVDLDRDGDLDIVTNEFNGPPQVLVSDLADRGQARTLTVRLRGTTSNAQGVGAVVEVVRSDGRRMTQANDGRSGYLGQSALPLTFGLGPTASARTVVVRWPSGVVQAVVEPPGSGELEIVESAARR
jgi:hypothetical protein